MARFLNKQKDIDRWVQQVSAVCSFEQVVLIVLQNVVESHKS